MAASDSRFLTECTQIPVSHVREVMHLCDALGLPGRPRLVIHGIRPWIGIHRRCQSASELQLDSYDITLDHWQMLVGCSGVIV